MWYLKHFKTGQILNINQKTTSIGRTGTTHILQNDDSISRKHCTFLLDKNELQIIDDGSKYGTSVVQNNKKVTIKKTPVVLKIGDKIQFGCFDNVWELHCETAQSKRKHDEVTSDENSLSSSNVSKKKKDDPVKTADKFDIIIGSSDEEVPVTTTKRNTRQQKNAINDSQSQVPRSSKKPVVEKQPKKVTEKPKSSTTRSQVFNDSDEDIFGTASENVQSLCTTKNLSSNSKDEEIMAFNPPQKSTVNSAKKKPDDKSDKKIVPRNTRSLRSDVSQNISISDVPEPSSSRKSKSPAVKPVESPDATDGTSSRPSSVIRKRIVAEDAFEFNALRPAKRVKQINKKDEESSTNNSLEPIASTSNDIPKKIKSAAFKTTDICHVELFASVEYDTNDSCTWLSTKISTIKVKEESDETDGSVFQNSSLIPACSYSGNIVRKCINLDTTLDYSKSFQKQKVEDTTETVRLRKLNVKDMNICYSNDDANLTWS